ncbi:rab-like protein 2A [Lepeophtheirus salmonis]|nr:rab-like protein 2A [Lepeophtheirus salmonis]
MRKVLKESRCRICTGSFSYLYSERCFKLISIIIVLPKMTDAEGEKIELDYDEATVKGELAVKVICLGDSAVGKSKLVERYLVNGYKPQQLSTYALSLFRHRLNVENEEVLTDFWDTAGQERFQSMHRSYYHQAHACILVFDSTRKSTYKSLTKWYSELRKYRPYIPCLCAVNKIDENMEITKKSFTFATRNDIPLYYVSASDGTNVVKLFTDAVHKAIEYKKNPIDMEDQILEELDRM